MHHSTASVALREGTLSALRRTYERLSDPAGTARIDGIRALRRKIEDATRDRDAEALRALKERAAGDWELEQVQIALARTLGRLGDWPAAAEEYGELIVLLERERPHGVIQHSLYAKHARALRNMGLRQEALVAAARGQLQNPLSACARREVGKAHFSLMQFEEALEAWQQALWLTPNDPYLHWKVAFCHWRVAQDRRDEAARGAALAAAAAGFEQSSTLFGPALVEGWAWSQLWAGRVQAELGANDAAIRHLRSAAGCEPTSVPGALLLGEAYRAAGEHGASRVQLERAHAAAATPAGARVDEDWGETLSDREVAVRAAVGLGYLELEDESGRRRALARATEARALAKPIEDPIERVRCLAEVDGLEAAATARTRGDDAPGLVAVSR